MSRIVGIINHILAECLNYFFLATIIAVYYLVTLKEWPVAWKMILLILVPLWLYFLREKCKWAVLFFAGHILPVPIIIGIYGEELMARVYIAVLLCVLVGVSIKKRFTDYKTEVSAVYLPAAIVTFFVLYTLDAMVGTGKSFDYLINATFLYCAGYFVYTYLSGFERYVALNNKSADNIPEGKVFQMSFSMAAAFIGLILVFVDILADREVIDALVIAIRDFLMNLIRTVVFLVRFTPSSYGPDKAPIDRQELVIGEVPNDSLLGKILLAIVSAVIVILILVIVIAGLIALVKVIREAFLENRKKTRKCFKEEVVDKDKVEFLFGRKNDKEMKHSKRDTDIENTYSRQIRRIYEKTLWQKYKILKEEKTGKLLKRATARECCLQIFKEQEEVALGFAGLYEKARYAKEQCRRSHVKEMKKYADTLLKK